MKRKICILPLIFSLVLSGCHTASDDLDSLDSSETASFSHKNSAVFSYSTSVLNYPGNEEGSYLLQASCAKPTISIENNQEAAAAINLDVGQQQQAFRFTVVEYLRKAKDLQQTSPEKQISCRLEQSYRPMRMDDQIISLRQDTLWSDAPQSELMSYQGLNYNASTGERLTLASIASDKTALQDSMISYLIEQLHSPVYEDCLRSCPYTADEAAAELVSHDNLWFFTDYGITFIANAPSVCSQETHTVTVPYQQLDGLKPEYQYVGPYHLQGLVGSAISGDMDNNETVEALYYNTVWNEEQNAVSSTIIVDGDDCSALLSELEPALSAGAAASPDQYYYLIDLDVSDNYIELAIPDRGTADQPGCTHFFRYAGFDLIYMGRIDDFVESDTFRATGDGSIHCLRRLSLLPDFKTAATYEISGNRLEPVEEDWYPLVQDTDEPPRYTWTGALTLYLSDSRFSESRVLYPEDTTLSLIACDEDHWLQTETQEGEILYLHLDDVNQLDDDTALFDVLQEVVPTGQ